VNCLADENRNTRKRALEKIHRQGLELCKEPSSLMQGFLDFLLKPLLKVLSDPVEKCRELSISFFAE
jgi:dynein assembly factor 5